MKLLIYSLVSAFLLMLNPGDQFVKPEVFKFGSSLSEMQAQLKPYCDSIVVRSDEQLQLPTARNEQAQLDVYGFTYAGKKRKAELIFADDQLDLVWILTEESEEKAFLDDFTKRFGAPSHNLKEVTFFLDHGVAVRNEPHEVLFISERLKAPYKQWLDSQVNQ